MRIMGVPEDAMRMPVWVAGPCVVLGAVLGALVMWSLGDSPQRPSPALAPPDEITLDREAPPPARDQPVFPTDAPLAPLEDIHPATVTQAPLPVLPAGDGEISGRVVDQLQRGIAGAEVVLVLNADEEAPRPPPRREFDSDAEYHDAFLRFTAERLRRESAATRRTFSEEDGSFVLSGLPDLPGRISANADGYRFNSAPEHRSVHPGAALIIEGVQLGRLRIDARYPGGGTPESGSVNIQREDSQGRAVNHDWQLAREGIELEPGTYRARFTGREPPGTGISESIEIVPGEETSARIEMQALARLRVALRFREARPVTSQLILFRATDEGTRGAQSSARQVRTPATEAELGDVEPGRYFLVLRSGREELAMQPLELDSGVQSATLDVGEPESADYIDVVVNVPRGNWRAETATVRITGAITTSDQWHLGGDRFRVYYSPRTSQTATLQATANISGLGILTRAIDPRREREIQFTFEEPASLSVRLDNLPGSLNLHSFRISFMDEAGVSRGTSQPAVAIPGRPGEALVRLTAVQPGRGELRLMMPGMGNLPNLTLPVELAPGHRELRWSLPAMYTLGVTVHFGQGVSSARIRLLDGNSRYVADRNAGRDGTRATFTNLPAGAYTVRITSQSSQIAQDYPIQINRDQEMTYTVHRQ
jgi:hypothetical protein